MTYMILKKTGETTEIVHCKNSKRLRLVLVEYYGGRRMHCYGVQFKFLFLGFEMPSMNILTFLKMLFFDDKEKSCTRLKLLMVHQLIGIIYIIRKKVRGHII